MQTHYIAGYKFIRLTGLTALQQALQACCSYLSLKGTVLLSEEGININLAGMPEAIEQFKSFLNNDSRFDDMCFHEMSTETLPFQRLKIKIKKEIITLRQSNVHAALKRANSISPQQLKQWLDEQHTMTLLDTRNDYEVDYGTFNGALNLHLKHFGEFPQAINQLDKDKPVVMFCTGGIRCEKAALYMEDQGFKEVYQLDGGILGYFNQVGETHYSGGCFVFDERVSVKADSFS